MRLPKSVIAGVAVLGVAAVGLAGCGGGDATANVATTAPVSGSSTTSISGMTCRKALQMANDPLEDDNYDLLIARALTACTSVAQFQREHKDALGWVPDNLDQYCYPSAPKGRSLCQNVDTTKAAVAPTASAADVTTDAAGDIKARELDLLGFTAVQRGTDVTLTWTLGAAPRNTLVAARTPDYVIAAVKVYGDGSAADAYVFDGTNTPLTNFSIVGATVVLTVPQSFFGEATTLTASTERVGGRAGDDGPTVSITTGGG